MTRFALVLHQILYWLSLLDGVHTKFDYQSLFAFFIVLAFLVNRASLANLSQ